MRVSEIACQADNLHVDYAAFPSLQVSNIFQVRRGIIDGDQAQFVLAQFRQCLQLMLNAAQSLEIGITITIDLRWPVAMKPYLQLQNFGQHIGGPG